MLNEQSIEFKNLRIKENPYLLGNKIIEGLLNGTKVFFIVKNDDLESVIEEYVNEFYSKTALKSINDGLKL